MYTLSIVVLADNLNMYSVIFSKIDGHQTSGNEMTFFLCQLLCLF